MTVCGYWEATEAYTIKGRPGLYQGKRGRGGGISACDGQYHQDTALPRERGSVRAKGYSLVGG